MNYFRKIENVPGSNFFHRAYLARAVSSQFASTLHRAQSTGHRRLPVGPGSRDQGLLLVPKVGFVSFSGNLTVIS